MATKTFTAAGNAQISTAQFKFGTSSGLFDGAGDYITTPDHVDFYYNADYTIEFFLRYAAVGNGDFVTQTDNAGEYARMRYDGTNLELACQTSGPNTGLKAWSPSTAVWYHVALSRNGNNFRFFVDGTQVGSTTVDATAYVNLTGALYIGSNGTIGSYINAYIDELRISKGIARYTSNFTAPSSPFTTDAYTVVLLHFEGANGSTTFTDSSASSTTRGKLISIGE